MDLSLKLRQGFNATNGVLYGPLGLKAVFLYVSPVAFAMSEASGSSNAAAHTGHTFYEVGVYKTLALFEKRKLAFIYSIAGTGLQFKVRASLLLKALCNGIGKASAASEYPS